MLFFFIWLPYYLSCIIYERRNERISKMVIINHPSVAQTVWCKTAIATMHFYHSICHLTNVFLANIDVVYFLFWYMLCNRIHSWKIWYIVCILLPKLLNLHCYCWNPSLVLSDYRYLDLDEISWLSCPQKLMDM